MKSSKWLNWSCLMNNNAIHNGRSDPYKIAIRLVIQAERFYMWVRPLIQLTFIHFRWPPTDLNPIMKLHRERASFLYEYTENEPDFVWIVNHRLKRDWVSQYWRFVLDLFLFVGQKVFFVLHFWNSLPCHSCCKRAMEMLKDFSCDNRYKLSDVHR